MFRSLGGPTLHTMIQDSHDRPTNEDDPISRRHLLTKLSGAALAGAGLAAAGSALAPSPASAATITGDGGTTGDGVRGIAHHTSFSGVYAENTTPGFGVFATVGPGGKGVHGDALGDGKGVEGVAYQTGTGVYGVRGAGPTAAELPTVPAAGVVGFSKIGDAVAGLSQQEMAAGVSGTNSTALGAGVHGTFGQASTDSPFVTAGVWGDSKDAHGVFGTSLESFGVVGSSTDGAGVVGDSESHHGVWGRTYGRTAAGVSAQHFGDGVGLLAMAAHAQLWLFPVTTPGAPAAETGLHGMGEIRLDRDGDLWVCTASGTPGTWQKVAYGGAAGGGTTTINPTRVCDTRAGSGPGGAEPIPLNAYAGSTLHGGGTLTIPLTGVIGPSGSTGTVIPPTATGAILNVTVTNTTAPSYLTVYPGDVAAAPTVSNLNWTAGTTIPNQVTVRLGAIPGDSAMRKGIKVFNKAGNVDVIVDVSGYLS
jgi:hypothetical protein